jgi:type II secretory pathway pseudopilin PulG
VELLVMIAVIAILAAILLPELGKGREASWRAACLSNLRQLAMGNQAYADDRGSYVPAAADIWGLNLQRWHGRRATADESFDAAASPLAPYLGAGERIRTCGSFRPAAGGFESGCGGYGYNAAGVGSRAYLVGSYAGAGLGLPAGGLRDPAHTVMFADAAFPQRRGSTTALIEYSFVEPYRHLADTQPEETYVAEPSMHFRHGGCSNVEWCDGHGTAEPLTVRRSGGASTRLGLGWIGEGNNALFDPF